MRAGERGLASGAVLLGHGAHDLLEVGSGAYKRDRVCGDGTENATERALNGGPICQRTKADGGRHESFVLTALTRLQAFVGVAERGA